MLVANSLASAPRKKMMVGVTFRRRSTEFFSWSKSVYCRMGLMTSTSAGTTPAKKAPGPPLRSIPRTVLMVVGALAGAFCAPPFSSSTARTSRLRVVMRVLTIQMGLVRMTVAEPARAPAMEERRVGKSVDQV